MYCSSVRAHSNCFTRAAHRSRSRVDKTSAISFNCAFIERATRLLYSILHGSEFTFLPTGVGRRRSSALAAAACSETLQSSAPLFSTPTLSIGSLRFDRPPAKWDDGGGAVASLSAERGAINSCLPVVAVDLAAKQMPTTPACCVVTSMLPHSGVLQRGRIGPLRRQQLRELYGRIDEDKHLLCNRHHSEFYRLRGEHSAQARAKLAPSQKKRKRAFGGLTE